MSTINDAPSLDSAYFLAGEDEMSRLSNQHFIFKDAMGSLLLPPVNLSIRRPLRILDSSTADGFWICDLEADCQFAGWPAHEYVGTDMDSSKFPVQPPAGTIYKIQDMDKPWPEDWQHSFDVVYQRVALASGGSIAKSALQSLARLLKPNGWIQLIEAELSLEVATERTSMWKFLRLLLDIYTFVGLPSRMVDQIKPWLEKSGFVNIRERTFDFQLGASNKNAKLVQKRNILHEHCCGGTCCFRVK